MRTTTSRFWVFALSVVMFAMLAPSATAFANDNLPSLSNPAYSSPTNPFAASGWTGQCTWFAWGRAREKCGVSLPCRGNAGQWLEQAGGFATGSTPRPNSIAVWKKSGTVGHVGFVEDVVGSTVYFNEANWHVSEWWDGRLEALTLSQFSNRGGYVIAGYIYLGPSPPPPPANPHSDRVAYLNGNTLFAKEGGLDAGWVTMAGAVDSFQLDGDRIAYLSGKTLIAKDGGLGAGWVTLQGGVDSFQIEGDRVAYLNGTTLMAKEGGLDAGWVTMAGAVDSFQLDGDRIAYLSGKTLIAKDGGLGAGWVTLQGGVDSFQVCERVGRPVQSLPGPAAQSTVLTLSAPTTCAYESATLSGTLETATGDGLSARSVLIQLSTNESDWITLKSLTTASGGTFSTSVAPAITTYYRALFEGDFSHVASTSDARAVTPDARLTAPMAPPRVVRGRTFAVGGYLMPRHLAGSHPVKLVCCRHQSGRWVLRKTVWARASDFASYSRYSGRVALPYAGRWRIRAVHAADALNGASRSGWRYVSAR